MLPNKKQKCPDNYSYFYNLGRYLENTNNSKDLKL